MNRQKHEDFGPCDFYCTVAVNRLKNFQCPICGSHLTKIYVRKSLQDTFGDEWEGEMNKLSDIRSLVRRKRFDLLNEYSLEVMGHNGKVKIRHFLYALKD